MSRKISLSPWILSGTEGPRRTAPRALDHRNERYDAQFDADTVLYDVYRSGEFIVVQGPPLLNLRSLLESDPFFLHHVAKKTGRYVSRNRGGEFWIRSHDDHLKLDNGIGRTVLPVQPDESSRFQGKRVLLTLSKNNEIAWIADWIQYHQRLHGTDAVLFYDNASSIYDAALLQQELRTRFPSLYVLVVDWPFKYGPQGGISGGVDGKPAPWDSDFCQTGALQHARFRFLRQARSVLNCDIDELVVSPKSQSVFTAAEGAFRGVIDFPGVWVGNLPLVAIDPDTRRHGHYAYEETKDRSKCPNKWCVVPARCDIDRDTWYVHAVQGRSNFLTRSFSFRYRHFKPISNNWKYGRWIQEKAAVGGAPARDEHLLCAMRSAGLTTDLV